MKFIRRIIVVFIILILTSLCLISCITQPILFKPKKDNVVLVVNQQQLKADINYLTGIEGCRVHTNLDGLNKSADYIKESFDSSELILKENRYEVSDNEYRNVIGLYGDTNLPRLVVGAHYDVCGLQEGADDNASGVAGLLAIARLLNKNKPELDYCIELVAYTLEEPPYFRTNKMGSYIHAKDLFDREVAVKGMICLEMIGYFSEEKNSQEYPVKAMKLLYPTTGDFILITGNSSNRKLTKKTKRDFLKSSDVKVRSICAPSSFQGIDFSDYLNYWKFNYPAVMVCNTAFYRNKNYHQHTDTKEKLDLTKMSEVIKGVYYSMVHSGV